MGTYIKTYELFGNLFGKKKGVSKNVKTFLAHEKEEKAKKDKQEKDQALVRKRYEEKLDRFKERIESTIRSTRHQSIDRISEVEVSHGGRISVTVILNNEYLKDVVNDFKRQNGLSFKDIELHNPVLKIEFSIRTDFDKGRYQSFGSKKEYMGIYHFNDSDSFTVYMKDIIDYKGNVSDESKLKYITISHRSYKASTGNIPTISYESGETDDVDISQLKNTIIWRSNDIGSWLCKEIYNRIKELHRLKEFEIISTFTNDEVKDYMSDLIDISSNYELERSDEDISLLFDIPGLRKYEGKMRMTKLNSQVTKYLTEIQGRLEERELEISVQFEYDKLGVVITKMESDHHPIATTRMARKAPR